MTNFDIRGVATITVCGENLGEEVEVRLQAAQQELGLEEAR